MSNVEDVKPSTPGAVPASEELDDLYAIVAGDGEINSQIAQIAVRSTKPAVASFIARLLVWLFVIQIAGFTLTYIAFLIAEFNFASGELLAGKTTEPVRIGTEGVLQAVQILLPFTTTLLGVIIGYYFRASEEDRA